METRGLRFMGIGLASGDNRAHDAANRRHLESAARVFDSGRDRGAALDCRRQSTLVCSRSTRLPRSFRRLPLPRSNIIFGAVIDDSMMDQIRVTVIATGFDGSRKTRR